jgi:Chaperone of endosialidase
MKNQNIMFATIFLALGLLAFSPVAQAVNPPPDGGYPGFNTAEGQNALFSLTTGQGNTAVGWLSLRDLTQGSFNTAIGAGTLFANTGDQNTATGAAALLLNTTGHRNAANGFQALFSNTTGSDNTTNGCQALYSNTTGNANAAVGVIALFSNTTGPGNTALGDSALLTNTTGGDNTAIGRNAFNGNTTGFGNIALGVNAGTGVSTAHNVICIGTAGNNVDDACYIGNIVNSTSSNGVAVFVNSNGRLGTATSSRRFKEEIKPMDKTSEALLALKPVTFRYKKAIDPAGISQFGLVAEEVDKVNPDLVVRDKEGKPYSVRYDQVNAMLLNEFLKEHRKVEQQRRDFEATLAQQQKQIDALTAGLQKVSAQLEASKPAPRVAKNNQ